MAKIRLYEVAKQLGIDEQSARTLLQQQGAHVRNRLSAVEEDVVDRSRRALERARAPRAVEEKTRGMRVLRPAPQSEAQADSPEPRLVTVALDDSARAELRRIGDLLERLVQLAEGARDSG
jgi:hypothetical protein